MNGDGKVDVSDLSNVVVRVKGYPSDLITDPAVIREMLTEFIETNGVRAFVADAEEYIDYSDYAVVKYFWGYTEVPEQINAFIQENNIDPDLIRFNVEE